MKRNVPVTPSTTPRVYIGWYSHPREKTLSRTHRLSQPIHSRITIDRTRPYAPTSSSLESSSVQKMRSTNVCITSNQPVSLNVPLWIISWIILRFHTSKNPRIPRIHHNITYHSEYCTTRKWIILRAHGAPQINRSPLLSAPMIRIAARHFTDRHSQTGCSLVCHRERHGTKSDPTSSAKFTEPI